MKRSAIVTGGARRLGRAMVWRLAELGYAVDVWYNSSEAEAVELYTRLAAEGHAATVRRVDVRSSEAVEQALAHHCEEWGTPRVFVSNAGVFPERRHPLDLSDEEFEDVFDVNVTAHLRCGRAFYRAWSACGDVSDVGRLIVMTSVGGVEVWRDRAAYNVSKSAAFRLVQSLARSFAPLVAVNAIAPGFIAVADAEQGVQVPVVAVEKIPMGRHGSADDVLDVLQFFVQCSSYITGQQVLVDGGYSLAARQ